MGDQFNEDIIEYDITVIIMFLAIVVLSGGWLTSAMNNSVLESELARKSFLLSTTEYIVETQKEIITEYEKNAEK